MQKTNTSQAKEDIRVAEENALKIINSTAEQNAKLITTTVSDSMKLIVTQLESVKQIIASQAAEALKVSNTSSSGDHELFIRMDEKLAQVIKDVADIKTNTVGRIEVLEVNCINKTDHEKVVNDIVMLKNWKNLLAGGAALLTIIIALVVYIWTSQIGNINMNLKDVEIKLDNHITQ